MCTKFDCCYDTYYLIKKEKEDMFGVYFCNGGYERLITSRNTLSKAQKITKLLSEAYKQGYEDGKEFFA